MSRNMDTQQYLEFCEARQASFSAFHISVHLLLCLIVLPVHFVIYWQLMVFPAC